jgi:leader peptidase (prepilin peptidase)/N-methyltransferase
VTPPPYFLYPFAFALGATVGSFLNVCVHRIPRGESIVFPPSHCPSCHGRIRFYDNIPILSYLILGGRCRSCRASISPRYFIIEALTGSIFLLTILKFGLTFDALTYLLLFTLLVAVTFIDLEHFIIPNAITYPGIMAGLAFGIARTDWVGFSKVYGGLDLTLRDVFLLARLLPALDSLLGIIVGGGVLFSIGLIYNLVRKQEGMGMGDVKLLAMIGAFLGMQSIPFVVLVSSLTGSIVGISIATYKKKDLRFALPFGPFLSFAAVIYPFTVGVLF